MNIKSFVDENLKYAVAFALFISASSLLISVANVSTSTDQVSSLANTAAVGNAQLSGAVPAGVTVAVSATSGGSVLKLTYDSTKKEASLNAKFAVSVNGGNNGFYVYSYPQISFHDSKGGVYYVNSQRNSISPVINAQKKVDMYGQTVYWVPAGKVAVFLATATVDPKTLFAGSYFAQLDGLIGFPQLNNYGFVINAGFKTNSVTIVGEVTPYISSVDPNQVNVGDKMTITGQRLTGSVPYFDGVVSTSSLVSISSDGTTMVIKAPAITSGWHNMQVGNKKGMSNGVSFEVLSGLLVSQLSIVESPVLPLQVIPVNTKDNILGKISFTATNGDVKLGDVILNGEPSSQNLPFETFYMYEGSTLLGTGSVIKVPSKNTQSVVYTVDIPASITIASGTTRTLIIKADSINLGTTSIRLAAGIGGQAGATFTTVFDPNAQPHTFLVVANQNTVSVSNTSVSYGPQTISTSGKITQTFNFAATVTAGNFPIYLTTVGPVVFPMKVDATVGFVLTPGSLSDNNPSGDTDSYIYIAPGQSKTLTANYLAVGTNLTKATIVVSGLNYGTSTSNTSSVFMSDTNMQNNLRAVLFH